MNFHSKFLHISLFNEDSSGTIGIYFPKHKLEIDVKHASGWANHPFHVSLKDRFAFLPIRWKCEGLRILLIKRALD